MAEEKKDIYYEGRIYAGCNQSEPQYHEFEPEEGQRDWNQDEQFNGAMIDFDNYLATLTSYPVSGQHSFKDGQDVTGLYELQHQVRINEWRNCTKAEYNTYQSSYSKRIVAVPSSPIQEAEAEADVLEEKIYVDGLPSIVNGGIFKLREKFEIDTGKKILDNISVYADWIENIASTMYNDPYQHTEADVLEKEAGHCTANFKGEITKPVFVVLLEYIDDMKQRGWEFEKHERTDLSNGNVRIDYLLIFKK